MSVNAKLDQLIAALAVLSSAETVTAIQAEQKAMRDDMALVISKLDMVIASLGADTPVPPAPPVAG